MTFATKAHTASNMVRTRLGRNLIQVSNRLNRLSLRGAVVQRTCLDISGVGNDLQIETGATLVGCSILVDGNRNQLLVETGVALRGVSILVKGDQNTVVVANGSSFVEGESWNCSGGGVHLIGLPPEYYLDWVPTHGS